jgi:hypothetical protein
VTKKTYLTLCRIVPHTWCYPTSRMSLQDAGYHRHVWRYGKADHEVESGQCWGRITNIYMTTLPDTILCSFAPFRSQLEAFPVMDKCSK